MKRYLFFLTLLFTIAAYALLEGEVNFTHPIPSSEGTLSMTFHAHPQQNIMVSVAVGTEEYQQPSIPSDFEGSVFIPDSVPFEGRMLPVLWISRGSFQPCPKLKEVRLPNSLLSISDLAFEGCTSLHEITLPASLDVIYPHAFIGCTALRRVRFLPSTPPKSYNNDTFDEVTYATATLVVPAAAADAYLCNPLTYRFRYHAEELPIYNKVQP